ncbi:hypothetical protein [Vibrio scophthalmi]|uniref:Uncharacterized protein n=1 Tax=Vibrio scophthalmi TaxID=45658 RepID=A0A1E3WFH2_9VIBR|nr:hypothetical protein [Vibrio scophthalmi]ODS04563.1 hypothetical protein VSF3289_03702 [Vibrio scophthalmi]
MEIESFIGGSLATVVGVFASILATNKIEEIKAKSSSQKNRNMLYLELQDLADECFDSLDTLYDLYAKAYAYDKTQNKKYLDSYRTPKSLNLMVLKDTLDKCFLELNKEQRKGLRTLMSLVTKIEANLVKLEGKTYEDHRNISPNDARSLLSTFGVVYQLALALSNERERFSGIDKNSDELLECTLKIKSFSMEYVDLVRHANAV